MLRGIRNMSREVGAGNDPFGTDAVSARARTGGRTRRVVGTTCVLVLLISVGVLAWQTVLSSRPAPRQSQVVEPTGSQLTYFDVPTMDWHVGEAAWEALASGVLRLTPDGCPFIDMSADRQPVLLVFPAGVRGVNVPGEKRSIVDPQGRIYGTEGEPVQFGGGGPWHRSVQNQCAGPDAAGQGAWAVQDKPRGGQIHTNG